MATTLSQSSARRAAACARPTARRPRVASLLRSHVESSGAVSAFPTKIPLKHGLTKEQLEKKGVFAWPTWSCEVSNFDWSYSENEDAYLLEGRVIVTPDGGEPVEIKAGDFATFPVGMSCTWDVKERIKKHYRMH